MKAQITPESYTPILNNHDNFIDHVPCLKNGIRCPCGEDNNIYDNENKFLSHINTERHKIWLSRLNQVKNIIYQD